MNSIKLIDTFILICNEMKISKLPNLQLISTQHKHIIQAHEWVSDVLVVKNVLSLEYFIKNYNFRKLQILFNPNNHIDQIKNCHTLILDEFLDHANIPKISGCHTVHFICQYPPFVSNQYLHTLKYCHTIRTYSATITDNCLKKLRNCHKLELRHPQFYFKKTYSDIFNTSNTPVTNITFSNPFITNKGVEKLKNCHTLYLNTPFVSDSCFKKLKNCHTLYLNSWYISNKCIKKLKKCHTIYLFTQYETLEHINKLKNNNVVHFN